MLWKRDLTSYKLRYTLYDVYTSLICFRYQPVDDTMGSKRVAERITVL